MLIAGARGFAKQLLDVLSQLNQQENLAFFDDYDPDMRELCGFPVLKNMGEASVFFKKNGPSFALGVGNPRVRKQMALKIEAAGGRLESLVSPLARVADFAQIGPGCTILTGAVIENDAILGTGVLVNLGANVCHDCRVGDFSELSPQVCLTGGVSVGEMCFLGTGALVIPQKKIGSNCTIGAGAVVIRDVPDNSRAVGNPARIDARP
jgi:sugar O-acyltransferase (sialic acid O-acetyltransferase NeuD family)